MNVRDAIATWWVKNAEIRHGHIPRIGDVTVPEPSAAAATTGTPATGLLQKALPVVAGALLGAGGLASLPSVLGWMNGEPPAVVTPAEPAATVAPEKSGSLYQYLEDRGDHLP